MACKYKSFLFGGVVWLLVFSQPFPAAVAGETLKSLERELQALISSAKKSVVTVTAEFSSAVPAGVARASSPAIGKDADSLTNRYTNIGTGVIFDTAGHIITRRSIASGAQSTLVTCADGRQLPASFVGEDVATGFVVLKVAAENLIPIKLAGDDIAIGGLNVIIGNSLGVYPSVAFGTVNGIRGDGLMQVMAGLSPGNGGGPIVNLSGETVGVLAGQMQPPEEGDGSTAAQYNAMAVAYPAARIRRVARDIIEYGYVRKGWLGVVGFDNIEAPKIGKIRANSPAERAGLSPGDVIVRYAQRAVRNVDELARMVEATSPGDWVELEYERDSVKNHTAVQIGARKAPPNTDPPALTFGPNPKGSLYEYSARRNANGVGGQAALEQRIFQLQTELNALRKLVERQAR